MAFVPTKPLKIMNTRKINHLIRKRFHGVMKFAILFLFLLSGSISYAQVLVNQNNNNNPGSQNGSLQEDTEYIFSSKKDGNGGTDLPD